jgi:hypothetical protein
MAQTSIMWTTGGAGDGASAYTQAQVSDWLRRTHLNDPTAQGVIPDYPKTGSKELAAAASGTTVNVSPGAAVVYGFPYESTATEGIVVPTPTIGTTGHRIVLRADWTARTVRLALISSSNGVSALPALTQNAGTTWEIAIYSLTITTGGVITLTDVRGWLHANTRVSTAMLDDGAVATAKLADGSVSSAKLASGAALANLANASVTAAKLASGVAVANLGYTPWHAGNDGDGSGLDADTIAGLDLAPLRRQGGNATNWGSSGGTTAYTPATARIQVGFTTVITILNGQNEATIAITFPTAFSAVPLIWVCADSTAPVMTYASLVSATGATLRVGRSGTSGNHPVQLYWFAIGPA